MTPKREIMIIVAKARCLRH